MSDFTDDRVRHVCSCGWEGRWDESFAHIVAEDDHRIVRDYLPAKRHKVARPAPVEAPSLKGQHD